MRIPVVRGVIDRRILANYRIDPEALGGVVQAPFRPKLVGGHAIGGICLIRLHRIRPRFVPLPWGIRSENAAHRIAVEWDKDGAIHEGVYIPRRDTSSRLNTLAGGRMFPGIHHHASFTVTETEDRFSVTVRSDDGAIHVRITGTVTDRLPTSSVFASVAAASDFFRRGRLGYSLTPTPGRYDGLELRCRQWSVEPLDVHDIESSFFGDPSRFPAGSVTFDCALLMRRIEHEWHGVEDLCSKVAVGP
jgi:hypothetical protein